MTAGSKGRWVATFVVVAVTAAWASVFEAELGAMCMPGIIVFGGVVIGWPYGLVAGTVVGRYAGRRRERRGLVIAASTVWVLAANMCASAALVPALDGTSWLVTPSLPETALTLLAVSLAIAVPGALWLERWTRPADRVPRAAVRR